MDSRKLEMSKIYGPTQHPITASEIDTRLQGTGSFNTHGMRMDAQVQTEKSKQTSIIIP